MTEEMLAPPAGEAPSAQTVNGEDGGSQGRTRGSPEEGKWVNRVTTKRP